LFGLFISDARGSQITILECGKIECIEWVKEGQSVVSDLATSRAEEEERMSNGCIISSASSVVVPLGKHYRNGFHGSELVDVVPEPGWQAKKWKS
jgi:hypothetical protein